MGQTWVDAMRAIFAAGAAALASLWIAPATAQIPSRIEMLVVKSRTLSGDAFLRGDAAGPEVLLAGELRLPPRAAPKVPAAILVHGSGGISGAADLWARELNAMGVAAFILDTFSGRGITSTVADQDQLSSLAMMVDAYRALDVLAAHPRIRADRIAVVGFSKGAVASVYSAMDRFREAHGSKTNRFAAHVGFYTPCNVAYMGDTRLAPVPVRLLHGITDDYVSIEPCRDYVQRAKAAGADITLTEYPDSPHGFDNPTSGRLVAVPSAQSTRNCRLKEGAGGAVVDAKTAEPYILKTASCVAVGAHVGHNPETTAQARIALRDFVQTTLLP